VRNSLLRFCYLQLTEMSRLSVRKPDRGFESLSLRQTVWVAEKSDGLALKIARNGRNSATPCSQTGPEKVSCSILLAGLAGFLSERHRSSPVSTTPLGECHAITNR
jgi:hypothetical protein